MKYTYEFFIAGKTRNKENILKVCDIFDKYNIPYYCFIKDEATMGSFGAAGKNENEVMEIFEKLDLKSEEVLRIFHEDLNFERASRNLLLVLPAGKSGHMEAGIAYGWGHKCYAVGETEGTDSLYNIFEEIFKDNNELEEFLKNYK